MLLFVNKEKYFIFITHNELISCCSLGKNNQQSKELVQRVSIFPVDNRLLIYKIYGI